MLAAAERMATGKAPGPYWIPPEAAKIQMKAAAAPAILCCNAKKI